MFRLKKGFRFAALFTAFCVCMISVNTDILAVQEPEFTEQLMTVSEEFSLPFVRGVRFDPANPFAMEFIVDQANHKKVDLAERTKMLRYFLAALTIPEDKLWVNLSPYESGRIIDDTVAATEIGRTLLEQDYLLKQLSASLTHPDTLTGKKYWSTLTPYTLNLTSVQGTAGDLSKIWIKPRKVSVYDEDNTVFISHIDFKIESESAGHMSFFPELTQDVNQGRNFAPLRQMVYSIVLAQWFKRKFVRSLYAFYFDAEKTEGIDISDPAVKQQVFEKYVAAFNRGAYDITKKIRESGSLVKRKYFCGGVDPAEKLSDIAETVSGSAINAAYGNEPFLLVNTAVLPGTDDLNAAEKPDDAKIFLDTVRTLEDDGLFTFDPVAGRVLFDKSKQVGNGVLRIQDFVWSKMNGINFVPGYGNFKRIKAQALEYEKTLKGTALKENVLSYIATFFDINNAFYGENNEVEPVFRMYEPVMMERINALLASGFEPEQRDLFMALRDLLALAGNEKFAAARMMFNLIRDGDFRNNKKQSSAVAEGNAPTDIDLSKSLKPEMAELLLDALANSIGSQYRSFIAPDVYEQFKQLLFAYMTTERNASEGKDGDDSGKDLPRENMSSFILSRLELDETHEMNVLTKLRRAWSVIDSHVDEMKKVFPDSLVSSAVVDSPQEILAAADRAFKEFGIEIEKERIVSVKTGTAYLVQELLMRNGGFYVGDYFDDRKGITPYDLELFEQLMKMRKTERLIENNIQLLLRNYGIEKVSGEGILKMIWTELNLGSEAQEATDLYRRAQEEMRKSASSLTGVVSRAQHNLGGIDLNGMLDGVKVYDSSSSITISKETADRIKGIYFKIVGEDRVMPLNQIINLPPAV